MIKNRFVFLVMFGIGLPYRLQASHGQVIAAGEVNQDARHSLTAQRKVLMDALVVAIELSEGLKQTIFNLIVSFSEIDALSVLSELKRILQSKFTIDIPSLTRELKIKAALTMFQDAITVPIFDIGIVSRVALTDNPHHLYLEAIDFVSGKSLRELLVASLGQGEPLMLAQVITHNPADGSEYAHYYPADTFNLEYFGGYPITNEKVVQSAQKLDPVSRLPISSIQYFVYDPYGCQPGFILQFQDIHLREESSANMFWRAWLNAHQNSNLLVKMEAYVQLGEMYLKGLGGIGINYDRALEFFKKAVNQKINQRAQTDAYFWLAVMSLEGQGVTRNYQQALWYFQKVVSCTSEASPSVKAAAYFLLGEMHLKFLGSKYRDYLKILMYFLRAGRQIDNPFIQAEALYRIGNMYRLGQVIGIKNHLQRAQQYFEEAVDRGASEQARTKACYKLGEMHLARRRIGEKQSLLLARQYFILAADNKNLIEKAWRKVAEIDELLRIQGMQAHAAAATSNVGQGSN